MWYRLGLTVVCGVFLLAVLAGCESTRSNRASYSAPPSAGIGGGHCPSCQ